MTAPTLRDLRPHQVSALDALKASLMAGHRRPLLQAPTGFGKTVIAAHVVAGAKAKGRRVCFCVPSIGLVDQTFDRFVENGISPADMGVIQADHHWRRPHAPIQIATGQTLARRDRPETDVVVIDEAHIRLKVYEKWMADCPDLPFVGLTATPWAKGLGRLYDDLIRPTSLADLIEGGYLSRFRVFAPDHPDLAGVTTVAGDYHQDQLGERMSNAVLVANIVETWLTRGEGRPTLCFCVNRAHARAVADQFASVGVPTAYVDMATSREERGEIGRKLHAGEIKVVVNIGTLTTGIDWDVRCLILARPTKSEILFVQIVGRGLRTADGKTDCLILDHSDTHLRLGMVTDIDHETLDTGSKGTSESRDRDRETPLPWECSKCAAVVPARLMTCCECGFTRRPKADVDVREGALVELGIGGERGGKPKPVRDQIAALGRSEVHAQLRGAQLLRGRKDGWTAHVYREVFGTFPRAKHVPPKEPSPLVQSWLRSRDIAYAKARQRERETAYARQYT